ncbi:hypothetical protein [Bacteroides oleiciplenus]|uniref:hypothetical protein n=1 Tax=Bacteroides oleiciplenus TaxID=626931 RepID=UPI00030DAD17|nr:hypothetical protein [Bacteroides oleiciplenus]
MRHFTVPMTATCCHKLPLTEEVVQAVVFLFLFAACLIDKAICKTINRTVWKSVNRLINQPV